MRLLPVLLLVASCDKVIGLDFHPPLDAFVPGHDEDGDSVSDSVDDCPGISNTQGEDADGDGVGDACDPRRNLGGDRIAAFYAFAQDEPDWVRDRGSWTAVADELVYRGGPDFERIEARNGMVFAAPFTVEARFQIDAAPITSEFSLFYSYTNLSGFFCTLHRAMSSDTITAFAPGDSTTTMVAPFRLAGTFTARMSVEVGTLTCDFRTELDPGTAVTATVLQPRAGAVGLEGKLADTRTHFVIVYTR